MTDKLSSLLLVLIILCLQCLMPASANAQDQLRRLSVEQVSSSRVVVFPDHPDKAGIFIRTSIPRLDIDSNLGIVQDRSTPGTGEYQIIIEPFRQIIYITAPGFQRASFQTGNLNPRDVIFLEIEPEADVDNLISVVFNVSPATAELYVDGQQFPVNETIRIAPGNRDIRLESEGYRPIEDFISVDERNILFTYGLEEIDIVPIQIRSENIGATVSIDGADRGEIDRSGMRSLFLYPGTYTLQLSQSGFITRSQVIEIDEGADNTFALNLTRNAGELSLQVSPADARVLLNREDFSGRNLIELPPGRYRLEIEKEHHEPFSETIEIAINERLERQISLEAHRGTLQFNVSPNDARTQLIDANGRVVNEWSGIQVLRNVQAGTYRLITQADGFQRREETVQITRNQTSQIEIGLEEATPTREVVVSRDVQANAADVLNGMRSALISGNQNRVSVTINGQQNTETMGNRININTETTFNLPGNFVQRMSGEQLPEPITLTLNQNGTAQMTTSAGAFPLPPESAENMKFQLDRHYLSLALNSQSLNHELTGIVQINGIEAYEIRFPDLSITLYVNSETNLPVQMKTRDFDPSSNQEIELVTEYSQWETVGGVTIPYREISRLGDELFSEITVESHRVNN